MVRESRHLWVGNLPDTMKSDEITDYFSRFGRVEKVKILPKKSPDGGLAAFVDFVDIRSATKANETTNYIGDRELRTNYNEPGNHPAVLGEGRGRGRPHMYDRGHGGFPRRERLGPYNDDSMRRGRYSFGDNRPDYSAKRPRVRRESDGSRDSDRPSSPKYTQNRSVSASSQSERGRSSSPDEKSYSGSDSDARGKSSSPARSNTSGKSDKSTSIQIKNLSTRPGDLSIKDALFHEFKKVGEIVNIRIVGTEKERYALVKFRRSEDAEKSLQSNNKIFLGNEMKITIFKGENKDREGELSFSMYRKKHYAKDYGPDESGFDLNATRTLFVGNLDKQMTHGDLRKIFEKFGEVVDVDIKKQNPGITTYAFLQYVDIDGAMRAKQRMDREFIGRNRIKVGFGRGTPTNVLWLGNVAQNVTEGQLKRPFHPFGYVTRVVIDHQTWQALLSFDSVDAAAAAFDSMRNRFVLGRKILIDFASRSCKEGFYERLERTGQIDRRTLEASPPARPIMHQSYQGSVGRGRDFRDSYGKSYTYHGRYGAGRGNFNDYSQSSSEYYPDNFYGDEEFDDYERELRDYGHRQRERERERETGRRPESNRGRDRGEIFQKTRDRKHAFTPLSDDEQPHVFKSNRSDDDDDDYSEKDIQSKIVMPGSEEKKLSNAEEPLHEVSPEVTREEEVKGDRKERKKKKEKKEKSSKRKPGVEKEIVEDHDMSLERPDGKENENVVIDNVKEADEEKATKPEKKKKRKSSEKSLAAEEKARKKELKKLKKLKKLQADLSDELVKTEMEEAGGLKKPELMTEFGEKLKGREDRLDVIHRDEKEVKLEDVEPKTPPTPGLEEDQCDFLAGKDQRDVKTAVGSEKDVGEIEPTDFELEKLKELESKREELRRLEEEEMKQMLTDKQGEESTEEKLSDVNGRREKVKSDTPELDKNTESIQRDEAVNSDSEAFDLVIDEMPKGDVQMKESSKNEVKVGEILKKKGTSEIVLEKEEMQHYTDREKAGESFDSVAEIKAEGHQVKYEKELDEKLLLHYDKNKKEKEEHVVIKANIKHEETGENHETGVEMGDHGNGSEKGVQRDLQKDVAALAIKRESDASDEESDVNKDIYSSQSDSSGDIDDVEDEDDDDTDNASGEGKIEAIATASGKSASMQGCVSPDRTPPTPDLEEDTLRMQGKYPGYGTFPEQFAAPEKDNSPYVESDEEKKELEQSLKEANYLKRNEDKKRKRKDRSRHDSLSPDRAVEPVAEHRSRSPAEKRRRDEPKSRKDTLKEVQSRSLESEIRSLRGSPKESPDTRERKDGKRGESPRKNTVSRQHSSVERSQRVNSPDSRRSSPDRSKRDAFTRRGSRDRSISPRRKHSVERRLGGSRGRERELKDNRKREDDARNVEEGREIRDTRRDHVDFRAERDLRNTREVRDRGFRDQIRDGREFRDSRDVREIRAHEKPFRGMPEDRFARERFVRDRDMHIRTRDDIPERGFGRGGHRGHVPFREGYREPVRHSPPLPVEQRSRSPLQKYPVNAERRPRSPEFRHEGRRPRTPEHMRPRSPVQRSTERRRDRSQERRASPPPRSHDPEFHRKETERSSYRDQPERRDREKERERREKVKEETPPPPPPPPEPRKETRAESGIHQPPPDQRRSTSGQTDSPSGTPGSIIAPNPPVSGSTPTPTHFTPPPPPPPTNADTLMDLLRRYPVMWQGLFALKNDSAAVQMHFLSGNPRLAEASLPRSVQAGDVPPPLRISQRMKLEASQLDGVNKRIKSTNEHCMLLALPCGRDPLDVHAQTRALKTGFITYLQVKQAAGIINIVNSATKQPTYVLHIFPPCEFAQTHLARVAPDLLDSAADSGHLMVLITPV